MLRACIMEVYKLTNTKDDTIYVGCTTRTLHQRMQRHLNSYSQTHKLYKHMNEIGPEHWSIHSLETVEESEGRPCEQKWIDELKPTLNTYRAWRNPAKKATFRQEDNKKYRAAHLEELQARDNQYYHEVRKHRNERIECECGASVMQLNVARHIKSKKHLKHLDNNPVE